MPAMARICPTCGETFAARRADARYCSPKCRKAASRGKSTTAGTVEDVAGPSSTPSPPVAKLPATSTAAATVRAAVAEAGDAGQLDAARLALAMRLAGDLDRAEDARAVAMLAGRLRDVLADLAAAAAQQSAGVSAALTRAQATLARLRERAASRRSRFDDPEARAASEQLLPAATRSASVRLSDK